MFTYDFVQRNRNKFIALLLMVLIGILYLIFSLPSDDYRLGFNGIKALNTSWVIAEGTAEEYSVDLPYFGEAQKGETLRVSNILPSDFSLPQTIRIRSSMQDIYMTLDGEVIFDNRLLNQDRIPYSPAVSAWHLIDLAGNHDGSVLNMYISTDIGLMTGRVNGLYYGTRGDLIMNLFEGSAIKITVILFVFSVALYSWIISFLVDIKKTKRVIYLASFSMTIGLWMVAEMDYIQLLASKQYFVGATSYIMLPMATIMFILYMYEAVLSKYSKWLINYAIMIGIYLSTTLVAQLFFDIDFIVMIPVFIVLLAVVVLTITVLLFIEIRRNNRDAKKYLIFIAAIILSQILETLMYLIGDFNNVSSLSSIGIMVFLLFVVIDTIVYMNQVIQKEAETRYLREIAYVDPLTQGHNRAAFERDIDKQLMDTGNKPFRLTLFDLNKLKSINDQFGHEAGDEALILFYKSLARVFSKDAICYRIGGDEFMIIHSRISDVLFSASLKELELLLDGVNKTESYTLEGAYGSDIYNFNEEFREFKKRVDLMMYENKKKSNVMTT